MWHVAKNAAMLQASAHTYLGSQQFDYLPYRTSMLRLESTNWNTSMLKLALGSHNNYSVSMLSPMPVSASTTHSNCQVTVRSAAAILMWAQTEREVTGAFPAQPQANVVKPWKQAQVPNDLFFYFTSFDARGQRVSRASSVYPFASSWVAAVLPKLIFERGS